jgi:hypothetical protein
MPRTDETAEQHAKKRARTKHSRAVTADVSRRERKARVKHGGGVVATHVAKSGGRTKRDQRRNAIADLCVYVHDDEGVLELPLDLPGRMFARLMPRPA